VGQASGQHRHCSFVHGRILRYGDHDCGVGSTSGRSGSGQGHRSRRSGPPTNRSIPRPGRQAD
jgi:hypothetical protein